MSNANTEPARVPEFSAVVRALKECERLMRARRTDCREVLAILEPFRESSGFPDASPDRSAVAMSLVCATFGDCYRELGEIATAANWYRRAGNHREATGFAECYADMVVKNKLRDHYQSALCSLRASMEHNRTSSFLTSAYYSLVSMLKCWPSWRMGRQTNRLIQELSDLLGKPA